MCQVHALKSLGTGIQDMSNDLLAALKDRAILENKVKNLNKELQLATRAAKTGNQDNVSDVNIKFEASSELQEKPTLHSEAEADEAFSDLDIKSSNKVATNDIGKRKRGRPDNQNAKTETNVSTVEATANELSGYEDDGAVSNNLSSYASQHLDATPHKLARFNHLSSFRSDFHLAAEYTKTELTLNALKEEVNVLKSSLNSVLINQAKILTQNTHIENQLNLLLSRPGSYHLPDCKGIASCANNDNDNNDKSPFSSFHNPSVQDNHTSPGHAVHCQASHTMHSQPTMSKYSSPEHLIHKPLEHTGHSPPPLTYYKTTEQILMSPSEFGKAPTHPQDPSSSQQSDTGTPPQSPDLQKITTVSSSCKEPLSQELRLMIQGRSHSVKNFAVNLMRYFFTKEEMQGKNVRGSSKQHGKSGLDPTRVQIIKHYVHTTYPVEDKAGQWQSCVDAMNEALRRKR